MGLYVRDELGGWQKFYDTDIGTRLVEETVTRDVNHPSILFWDNGNEGGFNTNLDQVFLEFDPQKRRVLHPWAPFNGDMKEIVWRLRREGWLRCEFNYAATGPRNFIGVVFDYPENLVKRKRWLGDGPFRVWKNRLRGVSLGLWENDYNNTITGHRDWVYPEFKGCFANVRWLELETGEGWITVVPEGVPFVQVLTPEQPPDDLVANTKFNLPACGLGFLHAIPPIDTKFKPAAQGGPQGEPNVGQGEYAGAVSFYFGRLP